MDDEVRKNWDRLRVRGSGDPYVMSARHRLDAAVELPMRFAGLGARPYVLDRAAVDELLDQLGGVFDLVDVDVTAARTGKQVREVLAANLRLPSTAAGNWDAFLDGFADVAERDAAPLAIVVRGLDTMFRVDIREFLAVFTELERIVYAISAYRPIIPRQMIAIYAGSWTVS